MFRTRKRTAIRFTVHGDRKRGMEASCSFLLVGRALFWPRDPEMAASAQSKTGELFLLNVCLC